VRTLFTAATVLALAQSGVDRFDVTGQLTDTSGAPIPSARIALNHQPRPNAHYIAADTMSDARGAFRFDLLAVFNGYSGATGLAVVRAPGYEIESFWFRPSAPGSARLNVRLHAIKEIPAGAEEIVTLTPDDAVCSNNIQDMPQVKDELTCRKIRIVAPAAGMLTVSARPVDEGAPPPQLEIETLPLSGKPCCALGNPSSLPVQSGTVILANVEAFRLTAPRRFVLTSTLKPK
jgi:hypothetical protein